MVKIIITKCGCASLAFIQMLIIDGDKLPSSPPYIIGWLNLGGTEYEIKISFANLTLLLEYLNFDFVQENELQGLFTIENDNLFYTNPENFETGEIMIVYAAKHLIFKVGNATLTTNPAGYTATLSNGITSISHADMLNMGEVQVRLGNTDNEPIASEHTYYPEDPDDDTKGKIEFAYALSDINVYITLSQATI